MNNSFREIYVKLFSALLNIYIMKYVYELKI